MGDRERTRAFQGIKIAHGFSERERERESTETYREIEREREGMRGQEPSHQNLGEGD